MTQILGADGGGALSPGIIRDISSGGACIAVERKFSAGLQVRFQCSLGNISAVVRHCSVLPDGYLIGVEFSTPLSAEADIGRTLPATW